MIKIRELIHDYIKRDEEGNPAGTVRAIDDVSLDVKPGQFIAILGHNGSGKSTLAKHLNALLHPTEGTVWVNGMDTKDVQRVLDIRQTAGMVFQNPDNQIIGQVVEEDVGFGPENMGVPTEEIWERVEESRYVRVPQKVSQPPLRRTETARFHRRSHCHASQMHRDG